MYFLIIVHQLPIKKKKNFSILLATWVGMVKRDKKLVGRIDNVLLSNINLLPFDQYNLFHPANFHSIFSKIGFQIVGDL